jgi:hypothetical protein
MLRIWRNRQKCLQLHESDPSGQGGVRNNGRPLVLDDGQNENSGWNRWMGRTWSSGFQFPVDKPNNLVSERESPSKCKKPID